MLLWRHRFPPDIVEALVSFENPKGAINNSELELAGYVAHQDVLTQHRDIAETTTATGTDNLASLGWSSRGAVSAEGPAAYLLRLSALHQRWFRYQARGFYVPGDANRMADDCSRLWHLSDDAFVSYFNTHYPQRRPWKLCHLDATMASRIHSALRCETLPPPVTFGRQSDRPQSGTIVASPSWHQKASPPVHGRRKAPFDLLGKRPSTWVSAGAGSLPARPSTRGQPSSRRA